MKKFTILFALVALTLQVSANSWSFDVVVSNTVNDVYTLTYKGKSDVVKVKIFNKVGKVVYQETIKGSAAFNRPYNFSSMPYGEYTIEVKNSEGLTRETFMHNEASAANISEGAFDFIKVIPGKKDNSYDLVFIGNEKGKVSVEIFDGETLIFEETVNQTGSFKKSYLISKAVVKEISFRVNGEKHNLN
jgi:hypothetical protein